jgi:hypothetical protein
MNNTIEVVMHRISPIVDEVIEADETGIFKEEFDKVAFMAHSSELIESGEVPSEMLVGVSHDELKGRVEAVMWSQIVAGTLNDLSPEQIKAFDDALKEMRSL